MIRKAELEDLDQILVIIKKVVVIMQRVGNDQWSENYPTYNDFHSDIIAGELFVDVNDDGVLTSVICLNSVEPEEYGSINWSSDRKPLVIHRMAVVPEFHGNGLARKLFQFAEKRAAELKLNYIKSDTCSINGGMNALFHKLEYKFSGTMNFLGCKNDFYCYEKLLK